MEALGITLWILVSWAWAGPVSFGRHIGIIIASARAAAVEHKSRGKRDG